MNPVKAHTNTLILHLGAWSLLLPAQPVLTVSSWTGSQESVDPDNNLSIAGVSVWRS